VRVNNGVGGGNDGMYSQRVVASWCLNSLICGLYVCVYHDHRTRRWQGRSAQQERRGEAREAETTVK
jgi:hypothetical protein